MGSSPIPSTIFFMKKVLKPAIKEESAYYSDFSGKLFEITPEVEIAFEFNYGSSRDGDNFTLHLTHKEYLEVEKFLSKKLLKETKNKFNIK